MWTPDNKIDVDKWHNPSTSMSSLIEQQLLLSQKIHAMGGLPGTSALNVRNHLLRYHATLTEIINTRQLKESTDDGQFSQ